MLTGRFALPPTFSSRKMASLRRFLMSPGQASAAITTGLLKNDTGASSAAPPAFVFAGVQLELSSGYIRLVKRSQSPELCRFNDRNSTGQVIYKKPLVDLLSILHSPKSETVGFAQ